jgi:ribonuclease HII
MTPVRFEVVAGVDEAGRGPLAGPVVAAAVVLAPDRFIGGLADSKALTPARREALAEEIEANAVAWSVGRAEVEEIDSINILQASLLAMRRAVLALRVAPEKVLVDGNCCPDLECVVQAIVGGDACIPAISAASILAKVTRDREMEQLHRLYPCYGFDRHKGYPTAAHLAALTKYGPSPLHRKTFGPVRRLLNAQGGMLV